jgi:hypothetical protein
MPRVSQETIDKLYALIESLPSEARAKCSLCNDTLTHIVKTAEVETGAGTATVTRILAEKINEGAAPHDRVSSNALNQRVRQAEGLKMSERQNKTQDADDDDEATNELCTLARLDHKTNFYSCGRSLFVKPWDILADTYPCDECRHFTKDDAEDAESEPQRHVIHKGKVYYGVRFAEMAIEQLKRIETEDPQGEEALRKVIAWAEQQLGASRAADQEPLPPAKAERREKAREVLKPIAERAITAAIEFGLDKTLHINDSFSSAFSTGAGSGRVLVAEVTFKKMNGT